MTTKFQLWSLLTGLLLLCATALKSQPCIQYQQLLQEGDIMFAHGDHKGAINKYQAAMADCPQYADEAQHRINKVAIHLKQWYARYLATQDSLSLMLKANLRMLTLNDSLATEAVHLYDSLSILHGALYESQAWIAEIEQLYKELMQAMPLTVYNVSLATEFVNGKRYFYFVNHSGERKEKLGRWKEATPFRDDGFATVESQNGSFYLNLEGDTLIKFTRGVRKKIVESVDWSYEKLDYLPGQYYYMRNIKVMVAKGNELTRIEPKFDRLTHLSYVNLSENKIKRIRRLGQNEGLTRIDLHGNRIKRIHFNISGLHLLELLDLSDNKVERLPSYVSRMIALKELNLAYNQISELPTSIGSLGHLKSLDLCYNNIRTLPQSITKLGQLEYLGLSGNRILGSKEDHFFEQVSQFKRLRVLRIGQNPCSDTEAERMAIRKKMLALLPNCTVMFH